MLCDGSQAGRAYGDADADEGFVVRIGRFVVAGAVPLSFADAALVGFPLFSLLAAVLYVGYGVVYWTTVTKRRAEVAGLAVAAVALVCVYMIPWVAAPR